MDCEVEPIIVFDDSSRQKILNALCLKENAKKEIINEDGKVITNQDFESISADEFGGVLKGSKIMIKKDVSEIVKFFIDKCC